MAAAGESEDGRGELINGKKSIETPPACLIPQAQPHTIDTGAPSSA
jgi:hypothetical protein